jgi:hypothetical protein
MKNRIILIVTLFAVVAATAALISGREAVTAVVEDFVHWFQYFAGPVRRG